MSDEARPHAPFDKDAPPDQWSDTRRTITKALSSEGVLASWDDLTCAALNALRALPVEQRMEAMGMEKVALSDMDVWVEAPYVAPY